MDYGQGSGGFLEIAVDAKPDAVFFKQRYKSGLKVSVCGECGYLEFYAEEPSRLYRAYQNMLNNE